MEEDAINSQGSPPDFSRSALPYIFAFLLIVGIIIVTLVLAHGGQSMPSGLPPGSAHSPVW